MSNDQHTPEEFERAVKAFYFVVYGKSYHIQRTRTLKVGIRRYFNKDPLLKPSLLPTAGTAFAYRYLVVNLHRHWMAEGFKKLPPAYDDLPMPNVERAARQARAFVPKPKNDTKSASRQTKDVFYASWEWRTLRMEVLKEQGRKCGCCGAGPKDMDVSGHAVRIVVDHIKPISKFWHLRLDRSNLQVLCDECNQGKGAWDTTDWREEPPEPEPECSQLEQMIIDQLTPRQ
ncbi:HNH endonuclease [Mesorhizobium sp. M0514]|uniref:HNH endonuclease n=1 Tax=Mesorhizobium sp. M0514 TaxID=2956955 RepID=UPI0033376FAD